MANAKNLRLNFEEYINNHNVWADNNGAAAKQAIEFAQTNFHNQLLTKSSTEDGGEQGIDFKNICKLCEDLLHSISGKDFGFKNSLITWATKKDNLITAGNFTVEEEMKCRSGTGSGSGTPFLDPLNYMWKNEDDEQKTNKKLAMENLKEIQAYITETGTYIETQKEVIKDLATDMDLGDADLAKAKKDLEANYKTFGEKATAVANALKEKIDSFDTWTSSVQDTFSTAADFEVTDDDWATNQDGNYEISF